MWLQNGDFQPPVEDGDEHGALLVDLLLTDLFWDSCDSKLMFLPLRRLFCRTGTCFELHAHIDGVHCARLHCSMCNSVFSLSLTVWVAA